MTTFLESIDTTNPAFLQEYDGKYISDKNVGFYYVKDGQVSLYRTNDEHNNIMKQWTSTWDQKYKGAADAAGELSRNALYFDSGSLEPVSKALTKTSDWYRYTKPESIPQYLKDNNFGMGRTYSASEYTGETAGYTSGGTQLWKLKNGNVTSTPPPGKTSSNLETGPEGYLINNNSTTDPTYSAATTGKTNNLPQYQILDVASMQKYKPTDYQRLSDGRVVLNPGVTPISGTVKEISTTTPNSIASSNNVSTSGTTEVSADDKKWINDLYQKYFDRPASSKEIEKWAKETPIALEQVLQREQKTYHYVSSAQGAENKARYDAAIKIINESNLPDDIKSLWKTVVGAYPDATDFNTSEILNTFNKIKSETIDPYYKELANIAINDVKTSYQILQTDRERELEEQRATAGENIRQAKAGLEKAGMTFTGQGIEKLGESAAYARPTEGTTTTQVPIYGPSTTVDITSPSGQYVEQMDANGNPTGKIVSLESTGYATLQAASDSKTYQPVAKPASTITTTPGAIIGYTTNTTGNGQYTTPNVPTPLQTPFAGLDNTFYEGTVNQANRLVSTSTAARYAQAQQALGRSAESFLGSNVASGLGIPYTPAGVNVTGTNAVAQETKQASTLQQLIDQWKAKQDLKTNI